MKVNAERAAGGDQGGQQELGVGEVADGQSWGPWWSGQAGVAAGEGLRGGVPPGRAKAWGQRWVGEGGDGDRVSVGRAEGQGGRGRRARRGRACAETY